MWPANQNTEWGKRGLLAALFKQQNRFLSLQLGQWFQYATFGILQSSHMATKNNRSALEPIYVLPIMWLCSHFISSSG